MRFRRLLICLCIFSLLLAPLTFDALSVYRALPDRLCVLQNTRVTLPQGISGAKTHTTAAFSTDEKQINKGTSLDTSAVGDYEVDVKLFGILPLKKVSVSVYEDCCVIPGGEAIGIRIYTDGVLAVALTNITDTEGNSQSPAKLAGLQVGDVLVRINGQKIIDADHFSDLLAQNGGNSVTIEYVRSGENYTLSLTPVRTADGYKIGAWVRDSTAGLGTLTFLRPDQGVYAALGHGIADIDTAQLLTVLDGSISPCEITAITPGKSGTPGQLCGAFTEGVYGSVLSNSSAGIYGVWRSNSLPSAAPVHVASRFEIREGEAKIRFAPDGINVQEFDIQIEKVITSSNDEKSMVIHVTDPELLEITGGIVQGMSGSPILQNGRIVGAVTHVFVNDPTRGYGIFIENMLAEAEKFE